MKWWIPTSLILLFACQAERTSHPTLLSLPYFTGKGPTASGTQIFVVDSNPLFQQDHEVYLLDCAGYQPTPAGQAPREARPDVVWRAHVKSNDTRIFAAWLVGRPIAIWGPTGIPTSPSSLAPTQPAARVALLNADTGLLRSPFVLAQAGPAPQPPRGLPPTNWVNECYLHPTSPGCTVIVNPPIWFVISQRWEAFPRGPCVNCGLGHANNAFEFSRAAITFDQICRTVSLLR